MRLSHWSISVVAAMSGLTWACSDSPTESTLTPDAEVTATDSGGDSTTGDAPSGGDSPANDSNPADGTDSADTGAPDSTTAPDVSADTTEPDTTATSDASSDTAEPDTTTEPDISGDTDAPDTTTGPDISGDTTEPDVTTETVGPDSDTVGPPIEIPRIVGARVMWKTASGSFIGRAGVPVHLHIPTPPLNGRVPFALGSYDTVTDQDGYWSVLAPTGGLPFTLNQTLDCSVACKVEATLTPSEEHGPNTPLVASPPTAHVAGVIEPSAASKANGGLVEVGADCEVRLLGAGDVEVDVVPCSDDGKFLLLGTGTKIVVDTGTETVTLPVTPGKTDYVATLVNKAPAIASIKLSHAGKDVYDGARGDVLAVTVAATDADGPLPTLQWLQVGGELAPVAGTCCNATWTLSGEPPWLLTVEARDAKSSVTRSTVRVEDRNATSSAYGKVLDTGGAPLAGAVVTVGSVATLTNANGTFEVAGGPRFTGSPVSISAAGKTTLLSTAIPYNHADITLQTAPTFTLSTTKGGVIGDPDLGTAFTFGTSFVPKSGDGIQPDSLTVQLTVKGVEDNYDTPNTVGDATACNNNASHILATVEVGLIDAAGRGWEVAAGGLGSTSGIPFTMTIPDAIADFVPAPSALGTGEKSLTIGSFDVPTARWVPAGEATLARVGGGTAGASARWEASGKLPKSGLFGFSTLTGDTETSTSGDKTTATACLMVRFNRGRLDAQNRSNGPDELTIKVCDTGGAGICNTFKASRNGLEYKFTGLPVGESLMFEVRSGDTVVEGFPATITPLAKVPEDDPNCACANSIVQAPLPGDALYERAKASWLTRKSSDDAERDQYRRDLGIADEFVDACNASDPRKFSEFDFFRSNGMSAKGTAWPYEKPCDDKFKLYPRVESERNLNSKFGVGRFSFSVLYYSNDLGVWHWAVGRNPQYGSPNPLDFDNDPNNDDTTWVAVLLWYFDDEATARRAFEGGDPYTAPNRAQRATALSWRRGEAVKFYAFEIGKIRTHSYAVSTISDHAHSIVGNVPGLCLNCHGGNMNDQGQLQSAYAVMPGDIESESSGSEFHWLGTAAYTISRGVGNYRSAEAWSGWAATPEGWRNLHANNPESSWGVAKDNDGERAAAGWAAYREACVTCHLNIDHLSFWNYQTEWLPSISTILRSVCVSGTMPHSKQSYARRGAFPRLETFFPQPNGPLCNF